MTIMHFGSDMGSTIDMIRDQLEGRAIPVAVVGLMLSSAVLWALFTVDYDECDGDEDCICLLYTSPSPRDRTRSRMPSSA